MACSQTPVAWGVVDMQGWRKSMEDAHVAATTKDFKVFGVFDGHGGPEVARICQLYLGTTAGCCACAFVLALGWEAGGARYTQLLCNR